MRLIKLATIVCCALPSLPGAAAAYFSANFSTGKFPAGMTAENLSGLPVDEELYKTGSTDKGWIPEMVGTYGYMAVCPTRNADYKPLQSRLVTPAFKVEDSDGWLRWNALSVYPDFPDSYEVAVREKGTAKFTTLLTVTDEASQTATRILSLAAYAGKEIEVAFTATSTSGYMLAIGNIYAGTLTEANLEAANATPAYIGADEDAAACGTMLNAGAPIDIRGFRITAGGETIGSSDEAFTLATGESRDFSVSFDAPLNEPVKYAVVAETADGKELEIASGTLFRSHFKKLLFVDKGTGMWCNNCPKGILDAETLERRFGDRILIVEAHANDDLANTVYWQNLKFYSAPYFMLDRNRTTCGTSTGKFEDAFYLPVTAGLRQAVCEPGERSANVSVGVTFAEDIDNSDGRYRMAYTILSNSFDPEIAVDFYQANSLNTARYMQYCFLPNKIPARAVKMHNVASDGINAFAGIEGSLPASIKGGEEILWNREISLPSQVYSLEGATLAAYVVDTANDNRIVNSIAFPLGQSYSGIGEITDSENASGPDLRVDADGTCRILLPSPGAYRLEAFDIAGRLMASCSGNATSASAIARLNLPEGFAVVTLSHNGTCRSQKVLVR